MKTIETFDRSGKPVTDRWFNFIAICKSRGKSIRKTTGQEDNKGNPVKLSKSGFHLSALASVLLLTSACSTPNQPVEITIPVFSHALPMESAINRQEVSLTTDSFKHTQPDAVIVYFANDSHTLNGREKSKLSSFVENISVTNWWPLIIEGHTDWNHSDEYNQKLAVKRTQTVATALNQMGYPISQMKKKSKGESSPVASNTTASGRKLNRRVVVKISSSIHTPTGITTRTAQNQHFAPIYPIAY